MMVGSSRWPTTRLTLLRRICDPRDSASWDSFVGIYSPLIYGYCRRRGLQEADARDVTQDVLAQISRQIKEFEYDPERGLFRNWLGTVTHRQMQKHLRRAARQPGQSPDSSIIGGAAAGIEGEWVDAFNAYLYQQALEKIRIEFPEDVWQAFDDTFHNGRTPLEVAKRLEKTVSWVYQARFHVIRRLRQELLDLAGETNTFSE